MTKKAFIVGFLTFTLGYASLNAQTLDEAIRHASAEMSERLTGGSTVAVISFQSDSTRLTNYVLNELNDAIVRIGRIRAVERRRLDSIRGELHFNMSGEVSDESAQNIGRMLGAQTIIMGSIDSIGAIYRIRFQAISTENAIIEHVFSENINSDSILISLLDSSVMPPNNEGSEVDNSVPSIKFSLGGTLGITYLQVNELSNNIAIKFMGHIGPTLDIRFLFPLKNKLQLGSGANLTATLALTLSESISEGYSVMNIPVLGTLAPYAILGYSNLYLHLGYDFILGSLYIFSGYKINDHLIIGIPISLFGNTNHFGFASIIQSSSPGFATEIFQLGLSIQYVF